MNITASDTIILKTDSWKDESHWFNRTVGFDEFTLQIIASENVLEVKLDNGEEVLTFDDIHVQKWSIFENYFKAGNYLQSSESSAYAQIKYYELDVTH